MYRQEPGDRRFFAGTETQKYGDAPPNSEIYDPCPSILRASAAICGSPCAIQRFEPAPATPAPARRTPPRDPETLSPQSSESSDFVLDFPLPLI